MSSKSREPTPAPAIPPARRATPTRSPQTTEQKLAAQTTHTHTLPRNPATTTATSAPPPNSPTSTIGQSTSRSGHISPLRPPATYLTAVDHPMAPYTLPQHPFPDHHLTPTSALMNSLFASNYTRPTPAEIEATFIPLAEERAGVPAELSTLNFNTTLPTTTDEHELLLMENIRLQGGGVPARVVEKAVARFRLKEATAEQTLEIVTRIVGTYCPSLLRSFAVFWKESTFAGRRGTREEVAGACEKVGISRSAVAETKEEVIHRAWAAEGEKTRRHMMELERKKKEDEERKKEKKTASEKLKAVEQQKVIEKMETEGEAKERRRKVWEGRGGTGREFEKLFRTNEEVERLQDGEISKTAEASVKAAESTEMKTKAVATMRMLTQPNLDKQNVENAAKAAANITGTKDATNKGAYFAEDTIMTDDKPIQRTKAPEVKDMVMRKPVTGAEHLTVDKDQKVDKAQKMDKAQKVEGFIKFNTSQKANKPQTIATTQKIDKGQLDSITTSDVTQPTTSPKTTKKGTMPTITSTITKNLEKVPLTPENNNPAVVSDGTKQGDDAKSAAKQKEESSSPLSSAPSTLSESPESQANKVIIKIVQKKATRLRKAAPIPTRRSARSSKKVFPTLATDSEDDDEELEESLDDDEDDDEEDDDEDEVDVIKVDIPQSYTTKVPTKPSADTPPGSIEEQRGRRLRSHDTPPAENSGVVSARAKANETLTASRGRGNWKDKTPSRTSSADTAAAIKTPATRSRKNSVVDESSVDTVTATKMPVTRSRKDSLVGVATVITATNETVTTRTSIAPKTPATKSRKRSSPGSYPADDHPTSAVSITNTLKRRVAQHKKASPQNEQRRLSIEREKFLDPMNFNTGLIKPTAPPKKRRKSKTPVDGEVDEADRHRLSGSSSKSGSSELSSLDDSQGSCAKENSKEIVAKEDASQEDSQETTKHNTRSKSAIETENTQTSKVPTKVSEPVGKSELRHSVRTQDSKTSNPEDLNPKSKGVGKALPKKGIPAAESGNLTQDEPDTKPTETVTKTPAAKKNGRVTRQKALVEDSEVEDQIVLASSENIVIETATPAPKRRGRPGKVPVVATEKSTTDSGKLKSPPSSAGKRKRDQSAAEDLCLSVNGQTSGDNEESGSKKQESWKARKTRGNARKPREV